jgi:hypothetical protein
LPAHLAEPFGRSKNHDRRETAADSRIQTSVPPSQMVSGAGGDREGDDRLRPEAAALDDCSRHPANRSAVSAEVFAHPWPAGWSRWFIAL